MTEQEILSVWDEVVGVDVGIDPVPFARAILASVPDASLSKVAQILASEIECSIFEQHVQPALDVARKALNDTSTRTQGADAPPFANCRFRICDLPGQCRDEGSCHHPASGERAADDAQPVAIPAIFYNGDTKRDPSLRAACDEQVHAGIAARDAALKVLYGSMPESNGKTNWTAILHRGDITKGFTIARSEYPDRVRYEADRVRWLIGETEKEPWILNYDADKRSDYVPRDASPRTDAQDVRLAKFLHGATGDGCMFDGVDAGELFWELFPNYFNAAASLDKGILDENH